MSIALLIIDVQQALVTEELYQKEEVIANIKCLASYCREHTIEVIYVRHDAGPDSGFTKGDKGWEIYGEISPKPGEKIFTKKVNSAFKECGLREYLQKKGIETVIIMGLQTDYCIDASIKAGFEHGFEVCVPKAGTMTTDSEELKAEALQTYYEERIWNNRYAKVYAMDGMMKFLQKRAGDSESYTKL